MPAPTVSSIEDYLTSALISQGFVKNSYDSDDNLNEAKELPDDMKRMVKGLASALSQQWSVWMSKDVTVVIPTTSAPGSPSTGRLV